MDLFYSVLYKRIRSGSSSTLTTGELRDGDTGGTAEMEKLLPDADQSEAKTEYVTV